MFDQTPFAVYYVTSIDDLFPILHGVAAKGIER